MNLVRQFGNIDIYVFDQLLRGNIADHMKILDAGCGGGRNLVYMLREGFDVSGCDLQPEAVEYLRQVAAELAPKLPSRNFQVAALEQLPWPVGSFDVVLCNSVLHFARDDAHFSAMVAELWRVLRPGGLLFCRLGSKIGMDFERIEGNLFRVGDGQSWYLVDEEKLMKLTHQMGGELMDPLKTTVVQNHRCMTTWVLRKSAARADRASA